MPTFSRTQIATYQARTGLWPQQAAGLRRVYVGRGLRRGELCGLYQAAEAGIEDDPTVPWATVCEVHSAVVLHPTRELADAHLVDPAGWCEKCRGVAAEVASVVAHLNAVNARQAAERAAS